MHFILHRDHHGIEMHCILYSMMHRRKSLCSVTSYGTCQALFDEPKIKPLLLPARLSLPSKGI